jgi:DNA-binding CsgD family transcriptional regulator
MNASDPELISALFEAGSSASDKWSRVLDRLYPLVNAKSAGLIVVDSVNREGMAPNQFGATSTNMSPVSMAEYNKNFAHYEKEMVALAFASRPGELVVDPAFENIEKIVQRSDVAFAIKHFGVRDRFGIKLNSEDAWHDALAFQYDVKRGNVTASEFERIRPYVPQVARAIALERIYDQIRARYNALLTMLDRVNIGMMLLTNDCSVVLSNEAANETLSDTRYLSFTRDGRLKINSSDYNLNKLVLAAADEECVKDKKKTLILGDPLAGNELLVELSPFSDMRSELGEKFKGVIVMIVNPNTTIGVDTNALQLLYKLTDVECDVAAQIAAGKSNAEIAESRSVSTETIKSQVRSLFAKMGVKSRTFVHRKIISIRLPFRD